MSSNTSKRKVNNSTFQQMLHRTFHDVRKSGNYCGSGRLTDVHDPKVMINGIQEHIIFPLVPSQVKLIIEKCSIAPFGRKDKTILDTSVRHTWQLDPSSFIITNSDWNIHTLNNLKSKIVSDFDLHNDWIKNDLIDLQLYKLLLYEKDSFFKVHRDSEKVDGMFGTLVIILPSYYKGGEFVIKHNNQKQRFDYSSTQYKCDYYYLVFYADCEHEILPITDGYRLSLVYNIVVNKEKLHLCGQIPSPPLNEKYVQNICQALIKWSKTMNSPSKLIIPLKHKYTKANMSPNLLKGKDHTIASLLKRSIVELNENDSNQKYLLYCGMLNYKIPKNEEADNSNDSPERTIGDTYVKNFKLLHEINDNYFQQICETFHMPRTSVISVDETEFINKEPEWKSLESFKIVEEETGNEGTIEKYWYRMGILLLIPYKWKWCLLDDDFIVDGFYKMCQAIKNDENQIKLKQACIELFNYILYRQNGRRYIYLKNFDIKDLFDSLLLLYNLKLDDNQSVLNAFISTIKSDSFIFHLLWRTNLHDIIYNVGNVIGWHQIGTYIYDAFKMSLQENTIEKCTRFLISFSSINETTTISSHTMINQLLKYVCDLIHKRKSLRLINYGYLLHLLSLYEKEYLSSLQIISTTIEETLRFEICFCWYKNTIKDILEPILVSNLIKIWKDSSSSTNHSTSPLSSTWFISLYEFSLRVLNHAITKENNEEYLRLKQQLLDMKVSIAQDQAMLTTQTTNTDELDENPVKRIKKH